MTFHDSILGLEHGRSPASYSPNVQFSDPKCIFGRAKREYEHQESVPGPASYEIRELRPVTPAYTLGVKLRQNSRAEGPGPSSYRIEQVNGSSSSLPSPRWSFGYSKRWLKSDDLNPGPADYNTLSVSSFPKSPAFSLKSRHKVPQAENDFPGPGAYTDTLTQFE